MSDQSIENASSQDQSGSHQGPSLLLATAREKLGLSQKDVADKLFLMTNFIQYIDSGEFERFPKPAFVRGYIRIYSKVVGLSGDEMVALYNAELQAAEPAVEIRDVTEENVGASSITGPVLQSGLIGLIGFLLVIGLIWWLVSDPKDPAVLPKVTQTHASGPKIPAAPLPDKEAFGFVHGSNTFEGDVSTGKKLETAPSKVSSDDSGFAISQTVSPTDKQLGQRIVEVDEQEISSTSLDNLSSETHVKDRVTMERWSDGARTYITVNAGGFDQIDLTFSDECWVEVDDAGAGSIYNDLNRENEVLTIYGTAPFDILFGKATVVEMIYNGRPFDLGSHTSRDKTAKVRLTN